MVAAGCRSIPASPYPLAFSFEGRTPRLLEASNEIIVPLRITNRGQRWWDPARVHVSYHWLWVVPREIVRRSRTVPYHDGIRTDLGERAVAPGEQVALEGRLLAPSIPGVYWLEWDMVDEGITWFAQVAPRQPRQLVVVVPAAVWLLAPLPLVVALFGLLATGSLGPRASLRAPRAARHFSTVADVAWCAAALATKPLILIHDALLEPTRVAYWLVVAIATLVPLLGLLLLPQRVRPRILLVVGLLASLTILVDVVYYGFFGDVLSTSALLAMAQLGRVWGTVDSLFTPGLIWLLIDWPFACWLVVRMSRQHTSPPPLRARLLTTAAVVAVVAATGAPLSAPRTLATAPLDQMFRARAVVEQLGPFGYHAYDAWNYARATWLRPRANEARAQDALDWLVERKHVRGGTTAAGFGAGRGKNLIVVQVESLQDFAVDLVVNGQQVMPHLHRWVEESLRFSNVTDETSEGRTSDAEFATLTSLLPLDHGAVAFRYPGNHYVALPRVLSEHGYTTVSAVPFEPGFWNRQVLHPGYGFERSLFEPDFKLTEQIGWGLNDADFLRQMLPRLEEMPRPFCAWLITLSLHHPFADFPDRHKTLKLGALDGTPLGNYLHAMRFFDQALEDFKAGLARDRLLEESVVVVFGDHDAGFARTPAVARPLGIANDDVAWALNDRVPLFIRLPVDSRAAASLSGDIAQPAGQIDFAPTVLALLGIDAAPLPYLGRNLLAGNDHAPLPRPYGDWLDAGHLFLARGEASICYDLGRRDAAALADCSRADVSARRLRDLSRLIIDDDLQRALRDRLSSAIQ